MSEQNIYKMIFNLVILYSTFSVIYCREHFSKASLTVYCDEDEPMCDTQCVNHECDVHYCLNFSRDNVISDLISECQHFRCNPNCKHCYCYPDNICFCKRGYVINPRDKAECLPHCSEECKNGWCSAPETCSCDNKYKLSSNKYECVPKCPSACVSGYCTDEGLCLCKHRHVLRSCKPVNNDESKPQSCPEGYALQNNACKPVCEPKCEGNSKCFAPNRCSCPRNYKWSNETSQCESTCTECSNGILENGICMCRDGDKIDPNNKCNCISKCFPPCHNGYCSVIGVCTCKTNYTWNEDTSKCELNPNNYDNSMCVKINNETLFCTSKCKNCIDLVCRKDSNECSENYNLNIRVDSEILCTNGEHPATNPHTCPEGYEVRDNTCSPVCFGDNVWNNETSKCELKCDTCYNGVCIKGICKCNNAYKHHPNDKHRCISKCSPQCIAGECSSSGICICRKGYYPNPKKQNECITKIIRRIYK